MKSKILKFMYGRYGVDDLYKFLFVLYILLIIFNLFLKNTILMYISFAIIIIMFYRVFSKKIYKRSDENQLYIRCKKKIMKPFNELKRDYKNRKKYMYVKCYHCKTTLKLSLSSSRGIKHTTCPTCKKRITIVSLRKKSVE